MKVYIARGDEDGISGVFSTRQFAVGTFPDSEIEEFELIESVLPPWTYWHRGANVYPDGTFDEWELEKTARGECFFPVCDDHLNTLPEPWDGHTQGHCGEQISIFGTSRAEVEAAFQKHLHAAINRQNGKCQSKFNTHQGDADGSTFYVGGFGKPLRKSTWKHGIDGGKA